MTRAYVGLGANLGDRETTLRRAVELLAEEPGIEVAAVSTLRETDPVGLVDQPLFLNGAVAVETSLSPRELLDVLLRIEQALGRVRSGVRWGPRTVDLDVLGRPGSRVPVASVTAALEIPGRGQVSELLARLH